MMVTALDIVNRSTQLGFDRCGIIPIEMMRGYEDKLEDRMEHFPQARKSYEGFRRFARLQKDYPWARAVVVVSFWYGKYHIPDEIRGCVAKYYLTDARKNENSEGYRISVEFEKYLRECGFQVATNREFGITALRWAGMQAGIGIIRKNNFFYTEKGSYQYLEAFLIDAPLQYIAENQVRRCPEKCDLCIKACPTGSLDAPYAMCGDTCVSSLTSWGGWDLTTEPLRGKFGKWMYGCEACQDACPYNKHAWKDSEEFPELEEFSRHLTYTEVVLADYAWLKAVMQPKLWYIPKGKEWRYKTNALNAMLNNYQPEYLPVIQKARYDECAEVRRMANWVLEEIERKSVK